MKNIVKAFLFWVCFLSPLSSKSQEFVGLKGINTTGSDPSYQIYGVTSSGNSTLLNTWNATQSITNQIQGNIESGIINEYEGKIYFNVIENPSQISTIGYYVEYDISTNTLSKITNKEWELLYPKGIKTIIHQKADGSVHIGENSAVFKEENGVEKFWATDASGQSIPINITNGSDLQINGVSVQGQIDTNKSNIKNLGEGVAGSTALTAALTSLPQTSKESKLSCGIGTGAYSSRYAVGFGCASKLNERVDVNAGGSYVFGGSKSYGGGTLDSGVVKAGFVFKLGELNKPTQISLNESNELKKEVKELRDKNDEIISQNQKLLAKLEKLENIALKFQSSPEMISISTKN